ncbi:MAG: hypothetical protein QM784_32655 [Polyangiaceae bacterium]
MLDIKTMLLGSLAYLRENPQELLRAARKATALRFGVPIAALRWIVSQLELVNGPKDIELEPIPPGIRVTATVEEMGTLLRGSAVLSVLSVDVSSERLRIEIRLTDVTLRLLDDNVATPLAALVRSGALDLTRVANLVAHLPKRPAMLIEAEDDRIVLDLMRNPELQRDERLRRIIGAVATVLRIDAVETDRTHLDVALKALPQGIAQLFR